MTNQIIMDFLKLPPNIEAFPTYESKIHSEIAAQIVDVRTLTLTIMKDLEKEEKKRMFKIKQTLDNVKTQFDVIRSSAFTTSEETSKILSLHHETIIILDFLLLDRIVDLSNSLRNLEKHLFNPQEDFALSDFFLLTYSSLEKVERLLNLRKLTNDLPPTAEFFQNLLWEFEADVAYLESLGIIHEYDELEKPLKKKQDYYEELKGYFNKTCLYLLERGRKSIPLMEFTERFGQRYPGIEFENTDIEKIAKELHKAGIIGLLEESSESPVTILLADETSLQSEIIKLATEKGFTTQEEIIKSCMLPIERVQNMIKKLEDTGLAIVDDYSSGKRIYFPGLYKEEED